MITQSKTLDFKFSQKHIDYMARCLNAQINVAEGAVRAGKTVDNVFTFAYLLESTPDRLHLASGSTAANAKLNIGYSNGYGLEGIFRGRCRWGNYKGNDALFVKDGYGREKIVIFAGGGKNDSFKKIRGNSYGMWIATEINLHADNFIKEAMNRQLAAIQRKIFWDLNPDHPKAPIYTQYIDKYMNADKKGTLVGGYNYEHFTIYDNLTITKQRIAEIVSQYDENSIWYIRDILGKRSIAEGLIYPKFAAITSSDKNYLKIPTARARQLADQRQLLQITIGVDFGGNGSGHAFVASAPTLGYEKLIALASELHTNSDIDPEDLGALLVKFVRRIIATYGYVSQIWCDSAEPVLIRGMRKNLAQAGLGTIQIGYALKERVNDRIFTITSLCAKDCFYYTDDCETLADALRTAVWDSKKIEMERLDNGTSDIDSLDAFEYSFEHDIKYYIEMIS